MSRSKPISSEERKWKYILLLRNGGAYFGDTLWKVVTEIFSHRYNHWKRGEGWQD
tara:strand:- start:662 stop:826 length:165 start_codon:yes stop_codon:yes gene_type:complete